MPKSRSDRQKHTLTLRRGDYAWLQSTYPEVGANAIIRVLVQKHRDAVEAATSKQDVKLNMETMDV